MRATSAMTGLAALLLLAGCAENKFLDAVGAGKYVPDETQVHQNTALSMPPDLQLRPPANGTSDDLAPNVPSTPLVASAPPAVPATSSGTAVAAAPAPAPALPGASAAAPAASQDPYARYGISRIGPDGKPKPQGQLDQELRQAVLAEKRKTNPNYGTVFNIGSLFSGW